MTLVACVAGLLLSCLWVRAYQQQIVRGPEYAERARSENVKQEEARGARGEILDRNGRLLAKSVGAHSIFVRPSELADPALAVTTLSEALGKSKQEIARKLNHGGPYLNVAWRVGDASAARIQAAKLPGVIVTPDSARSYPYGHLAGQLLGFVGVDDKGLEGLERSLDKTLAGKPLKGEVRSVGRGRLLSREDVDPELDLTGESVKLTIDAYIQSAAEDALAKTVEKFGAKAGICVVAHVETGDILAMANFPFFNPNAPVSTDKSKVQPKNRPALDVYEPGSTMKPFVVAAALQEGKVTRNTEFDCMKGKWSVAGHVINDTHPYGRLPVHKIVRHSSNIGSAQIGRLLGAQKYHYYLQRLGFGEKTGLPLPGESAGRLRQPQQWQEIDLITASFGQGVSATALQMTRAYLCLAAGGLARPLRLVDDPDVVAPEPQRVFSPEVARDVLDMLKEVVEEEGGTASKARIPGLNVGGKTGTAQKAKGGAYGNAIMSSFIGLIPAEKPEYVVTVMIDEPEKARYGGEVAAPAVREVVVKSLAYMGKLPDAAFNEPVKGKKKTAPSAQQAQAAPASKTAPLAKGSAVQAAAKAAQGAPTAQARPVPPVPPVPKVAPQPGKAVIAQAVESSKSIASAAPAPSSTGVRQPAACPVPQTVPASYVGVPDRAPMLANSSRKGG